ncbi:hypothetical protein A8B82_09455 [Sulfitobacter sp. EhC04]|uniref:hypothetical protein n=1 Tax=Sulfitobacter sp. EhC04 TaxID=1849168 RepID=UPI0007F4FA0C|nr:hypothetical protein [Sulfitobacter sp. EhC04]OAN78587.1 hypothetical protein A8B82_09455 [Sulfitobacter sp. EhC04]
MTVLIGIFTMFFVAGPLVFRALTQPTPSRHGLHALAVFAGVFALFGLGLRFGLAGPWGSDVMLTVGCILALWLAWIGVLALGAQAFRRAEPGLQMHRWTGILGAGGTTVPWFGLASAQLLVG